VEGLVDDVETLHLCVVHFESGLVGSRVELGVDEQPVRCTDAANQLNNGFMVDQGTASPVFGDVAEEPMLDLVPLGRARRKMRNADGQTVRSDTIGVFRYSKWPVPGS
jgi:hypothetical protein